MEVKDSPHRINIETNSLDPSLASIVDYVRMDSRLSFSSAIYSKMKGNELTKNVAGAIAEVCGVTIKDNIYDDEVRDDRYDNAPSFDALIVHEPRNIFSQIRTQDINAAYNLFSIAVINENDFSEPDNTAGIDIYSGDPHEIATWEQAYHREEELANIFLEIGQKAGGRGSILRRSPKPQGLLGVQVDSSRS